MIWEESGLGKGMKVCLELKHSRYRYKWESWRIHTKPNLGAIFDQSIDQMAFYWVLQKSINKGWGAIATQLMGPRRNGSTLVNGAGAASLTQLGPSVTPSAVSWYLGASDFRQLSPLAFILLSHGTAPLCLNRGWMLPSETWQKEDRNGISYSTKSKRRGSVQREQLLQ